MAEAKDDDKAASVIFKELDQSNTIYYKTLCRAHGNETRVYISDTVIFLGTLYSGKGKLVLDRIWNNTDATAQDVQYVVDQIQKQSK